MSSQVCLSQPTLIVMCCITLMTIVLLSKACEKAYQHQLPAVLHERPPVPATTLPAVIEQQQRSLVTPASRTRQMSLVPVGGLNTAPYAPEPSSTDTNYHHIGYVQSTVVDTNGEKLTLPLYQRRKYPRQERYEYYTVDRNGIQIPFSQRNDRQVYDGDSVMIPAFTAAFTAKVYNVPQIQYQFPMQF